MSGATLHSLSSCMTTEVVTQCSLQEPEKPNSNLILPSVIVDDGIHAL